jgi:hypothetical protein
MIMFYLPYIHHFILWEQNTNDALQKQLNNYCFSSSTCEKEEGAPLASNDSDDDISDDNDDDDSDEKPSM